MGKNKNKKRDNAKISIASNTNQITDKSLTETTKASEESQTKSTVTNDTLINEKVIIDRN